MPTAIWVESISFTPIGSDLVVKVLVANPQPVQKARVVLELKRDGVRVTDFWGYTNYAGEVTFRLRSAANGEYLATVTTLTHKVYIWDNSIGVISRSYMLYR